MTRPAVIDASDLDLSRYVHEGDQVVWGQACAEPVVLTTLLLEQREAIGAFRCFVGIGLSGSLRPEHADRVSGWTYCGTGDNRDLIAAGVLDVVPCHYSQLPQLLSQGPMAVDVLLLLLSPPDAEGRYSMGLADEYLSALVERARVVIAEVDDRVPRTGGGRVLTEADVDVLVPSSRVPTVFCSPRPGAVEQQIAGRVAELIDDGATIQIGVGRLPRAILAALSGHRDLGIHSGLLDRAVVDLVEAGAVTGARKRTDTGRIVAGMAMGDQRLFSFVHDNPMVQLRETAHTHDLSVLASLDGLVAVNSALEVDLDGQVNAEELDGQYLGAVGGAVDFLRGARLADRGLPIVALPSTAAGRSRIVLRLRGPVSTARSDTALVVTEHGVADLRGRSLARRRELLTAIAAPEHRDALVRGVLSLEQEARS
jgi:acyl-CoA hydrolase